MAHLLVIENDAAVRFSLIVALQSMGHDVEFACDGEEGIKKCKAKAYELVITDLIMPQKDGLETMSDLKQAWPNIKVVIMSGGQAQVDLREVIKDKGAIDFLSKPFTAEELENCVLSALT